MTPEQTELVERLKLLERIMIAAHEKIADKKMRVWKDDIQALDVAIKLIENMEPA